MSVQAYLRSVAGGLLIHAGLAALVSAYVRLLGAGWPSLVTLLLIWLVAVAGYHGWRYMGLRSYYRHLHGLLAGLERPYLLGSLAAEPVQPELQPLWEALVTVSRSMADEVARVERLATDHREFVEGWVHEVKAPLAAARLLADGGGESGLAGAPSVGSAARGLVGARAVGTEGAGRVYPPGTGLSGPPETDRAGGVMVDPPPLGQAAADLRRELERIEALVEQALFFARANTVEQDYFIREVALAEPVKAVLRRYARQFIAHKVAVALEDLDLTVFTDRKWLEFILAQIMLNTVKYRRTEGQATVRMWSETRDTGVVLAIEDNGIGIPAADLHRVFDKGFTGANGRRTTRSTGIGLYLAKKLALALGHEITVESVQNQYTRVCLYFPQGKLLHDGAGNASAAGVRDKTG